MSNPESNPITEEELERFKIWAKADAGFSSITGLRFIAELERAKAKIARFEEHKRAAIEEAGQEREAWIKKLEATIEKAKKNTKYINSELERWRHGHQLIEDSICPDSLPLYEAKRLLKEALHDLKWAKDAINAIDMRDIIGRIEQFLIEVEK